MTDLNTLTIADARDALRKGDTTAVELTEACLTAIDAAGALNAFVHQTPDLARDMARAADARIRSGEAAPMTGIPLGIKDVFCVRGVPSQAASRILQGFRPEYESTVTQNLWNAGAVMLGKLNQDEFAMGSANESSCYGPAVNPWKVDDRQLTPGGSSGGSAAAVAAFLDQIERGDLDVLFVNPQSTNSATQRLADAATANNVPVVEIRETPPSGQNFLDYLEHVVDQIADTAKH